MPERVHTKFEEPQDSLEEHLSNTIISATRRVDRKDVLHSQRREERSKSRRHAPSRLHGIKRNISGDQKQSFERYEPSDSRTDSDHGTYTVYATDEAITWNAKTLKAEDGTELNPLHDGSQSTDGGLLHGKTRRLHDHTSTSPMQRGIIASTKLDQDISPQSHDPKRKSSNSSSTSEIRSSLKKRANGKSDAGAEATNEAGLGIRVIDGITSTAVQPVNNDRAVVQLGGFNSRNGRSIAPARPTPSLLHEAAARLQSGRETLPIFSHKAELRRQIRDNDVLIVVGETGSGKSTQLPQFLLTEPWLKKRLVHTTDEAGKAVDFNVGGTIAVTEPRRLAATSLAMRVAKEQGSHIGRHQMDDTDVVGYSIRFDHLVPKNAKIVFLTEGMLLQELQRDPHLRKYSAVIVDEIHERSINVDLLTGFLKLIVDSDNKGRGGIPLKVVIMSATANVAALHKFFSTSGKEGDNSADVPAEDLAQQRSQISSSGRKDLIHPHPSLHLRSEIGGKDRLSLNDTPLDASASVKNEEQRSTDTSPLMEMNKPSSPNIPRCKVAVHQIPGKQHDVKVLFSPKPIKDYVQSMLETIFKVHLGEPLPGDILAFLTGQDEIELLQMQIEEYASSMSPDLPGIKVLPLYAQMSSEQQQEAFRRTKDRTRKVVLATNVAETSVTVPGVRFVIDCGKVKLKEHRHRLGMDSLLIRPISKSSAIQRKGRAGREAAGKCYRLYTEEEYVGFADADVPEVLRSNVGSSVLSMKACKVEDVYSFPLMDRPESSVLDEAIQTLHVIGALDGYTKLSGDGRKMAQLPLIPSYAKALLTASEAGTDCLLEAIDVVACLSAGDDIFRQPRTEEERERARDARQDLIRREGDLITILTTMQRYACEAGSNRADWCQRRLVSTRNMKQALDIRRQLRKLCAQMKLTTHAEIMDTEDFTPITPDRAESLIKCFLRGLPFETAFLHPDGSYRTFRGRHVISIHPSSVLHGRKMEAIMYAEHIFTGKNYARKVSAIQMQWMMDVTTRH